MQTRNIIYHTGVRHTAERMTDDASVPEPVDRQGEGHFPPGTGYIQLWAFQLGQFRGNFPLPALPRPPDTPHDILLLNILLTVMYLG